MSQLVNIEVSILAYDSAGISNDPADADKIDNTAISGLSFHDVSRLKVALPGGGSLQTIPVPASPSNLVVIFADQNVNMQLNGGATQNLVSLLPTVKSPLFMFAGSITSLQLQSASGTLAANVDVWFLVS